MRKLLNTLYVVSPERYLALEGETVLVLEQGKTVARVPLHNLEGIVTFGYTGASPALMGACVKHNISLCFMSQHGRFLASVAGEMKGNVVLRKQQYRISDDETQSVRIARNMIVGKLHNSRWILERATRDHPLQVDVEELKKASSNLAGSINQLMESSLLEEIRGIEGNAASQYFSMIDQLILRNKQDFFFRERNRRPPLDNMNAMLSFLYTLLANDCTSALSSVGLDPYVGFLHCERPGLQKENGAVLMTDSGRNTIIKAWQQKKKEVIKHPFLEEKIEWGLIPYAQSLLLARYIRGELDEYPVFLWK